MHVQNTRDKIPSLVLDFSFIEIINADITKKYKSRNIVEFLRSLKKMWQLIYKHISMYKLFNKANIYRTNEIKGIIKHKEARL